MELFQARLDNDGGRMEEGRGDIPIITMNRKATMKATPESRSERESEKGEKGEKRAEELKFLRRQ